jgi:hypothetical protein
MVWIEIFNALLPVIGIALIVLIANKWGKPVDWIKMDKKRLEKIKKTGKSDYWYDLFGN